MLKRHLMGLIPYPHNQPPSGGCVLKPSIGSITVNIGLQPPSGGCVLKLSWRICSGRGGLPAAFRRLCVETSPPFDHSIKPPPAAFRRLCVETYCLFR